MPLYQRRCWTNSLVSALSHPFTGWTSLVTLSEFAAAFLLPQLTSLTPGCFLSSNDGEVLKDCNSSYIKQIHDHDRHIKQYTLQVNRYPNLDFAICWNIAIVACSLLFISLTLSEMALFFSSMAAPLFSFLLAAAASRLAILIKRSSQVNDKAP